jgi:general secretion pathway protein D
MSRVCLAALLFLSALSAGALQDEEEKKLTFAFHDASIDTVLQYVSSETGWIIVQHEKVSGKVSAVSDAEVPVSRTLDFLNAVLRPLGAVITNPYSPRAPRAGEIVKIVNVDEAKRRNIEIYVGLDPDQIPVSDQVRTQIIPLKAVNVVEVNKELGTLLREAMGTEGEVALSTYANSMVMTGRSDGIHRAARVLKVIDVASSGELKISVFPLKNADATETARTLNEVFKRETERANSSSGSSGGFGGFFDMFRGGRGGDHGSRGSSSVSGRALAHEMVRITPEARTNSIIVSATEDNTSIIADLIQRLDDTSAAAVRLKVYPLSHADATEAAELITKLFSEESQESSRDSSNRMMPFFMRFGRGSDRGERDGGGDGGGNEAGKVKAIAEIRTNSVLVAATEQNHALVDEVINEIDRDIDDILEVKIYRLKNAEPTQMVEILQALFRAQVNATQQAGSNNNSGNRSGRFSRFMAMNQGETSTKLTPNQQVEITSDVRTRSVIVKASREYIEIIDDVIRDLDTDPVEEVGTYVIPLRNADAATLAPMLQNLLRSGTTGGAGRNLNTTNPRTTGRTTGTDNSSRGLDYGTGGSAGSSRTRNLGPLAQDTGAPAPPAATAEAEDGRRGIEGDVDIESDPSTNSIVLRTSPRNYEALQGVIQDLDRMRPQVLIKVLIADVTLDDRMEFGVEGFWENRATLPHDDVSTNRFGTDFPLPTTGFSYLLTGDEFQAALNAFAQEGNLKILATPRILVLDNETATINVGKRVPIVTNTTINQLGNAVNTVAYENVGILLDVTPQINPDGLVTMLVAPEISDVASEAESVQISDTVNSPTFNVNAAETRVAVRNGTTVVIGGLIREAQDETVRKIPILGDIPLIGALFSSTTTRTVKRELMIFLTPYVAFTAADLDEITGLERSRLKLLDPRDIEAESDSWLKEVRQ